jgi:transcriptional regulator with XRE-family HTH domain
LTALRILRDVKQTDLAERAGLSQSDPSDIECGRRKGTPETLVAIAKAQDVSPAWLE